MTDELASLPLWERLPPRPVTSKEVAAAIPDEYPGDTFTVAAEEPLENDEFHRLLVGGVGWHYLALTHENGEPVGWERMDHDGPEAFTFDPPDPCEVAAHFGLPDRGDEWAQMAYDPDAGEGKRYLAEDATMYGYSVLDEDETETVRENLVVETGLRNGDMAPHEAAGRLFSAREPTVNAVENALAHLADALAPLVEAVKEAAKELAGAFSDLVDLAELDPPTAGAVAQAWHETDGEVDLPPTHPNARCSTVPMYASHVEFGDLAGERESFAISDVNVSVENDLVTEAAERATRAIAEQAERRARERGVRR